MNKKMRLVMRSTILLVIVVAVGYTFYQMINADEVLQEGDIAPNFVLKNMNGDTVQLKDYRGQGVMLNFWQTTCPPCLEEMPAINEVYKNLDHKKVKVFAVNLMESEFIVNQFIERHDLTFPILLDEKGEIMEAYDVGQLPVTFFVDKNGVIVIKHEGFMPSEAFISKKIQTILP